MNHRKSKADLLSDEFRYGVKWADEWRQTGAETIFCTDTKGYCESMRPTEAPGSVQQLIVEGEN